MLTLALSLLLATPPAGGIVQVSRNLSRAHACPVGDGLLLTAKHVSPDRGPVAWSDQAGNEGVARFATADEARDLIVLQIEWGEPGHLFALAKRAPKRGDRVWVMGYGPDDDPTDARLMEAKVRGTSAGLLYYDKSPGPGSSGSCVWNDDMEVVAINSASESNAFGQIVYCVGPRVDGVWQPKLREE